MADQFISLLCSRLLEDGASDSIDDSILREALQDSIHHLPQGTIKTALEEDFVTYYEKLKRLLSPDVADEDSPPSSPQSNAVHIGITSAIGLMAALEALNETTDWEKKQEMYIVLLLGSLKNSSNLHRVLDQWSNDLKGRDTDVVLSSVQQCFTIICSSPSCLVPWLTCCLKVFPALLSTTMERGPVAKELTLIGSMIIRVITAAHINHCQNDEEGSQFYNLMSALLSVYIDVCLHLCSFSPQSVSGCNITNTALTVLGHSPGYLLDTVLQVTTPSTQPETAAMLFPVICTVLQSARSLSPMTPLQYIKIVSCYQIGRRLQALCSSTDSLHWVRSVQVPGNFSEWLWSISSRVCESLSLRKSWSSEKIARHLFRPLSPSHVDLLVELVTKASGPLSLSLELQQPVVDSAELFFKDSCGSYTSDVESREVIEMMESMPDREEICTADNASMNDCSNSSVTHTMAEDLADGGNTLRQTPGTVDGKSPVHDVITYDLAGGMFSVPPRPATSRRKKLLVKLARSSSASPLSKSPKLVSPKRLRRSTRKVKN